MKETVSAKAVDRRGLAVSLIAGILVAYAITCASFIGCALVLTYTGMSENAVSLIVTGTCVVSVAVAGYDAAKGAKSKGWLVGIVAGGIYAVVLIIIGKWVSVGFAFDSRTVTLSALCLAGGGLGGVFGVNARRKG